MSQERTVRINKVLRELNISLETAFNFFKKRSIIIDKNPNAKISEEEHGIIKSYFLFSEKPLVILQLEDEFNISLQNRENNPKHYSELKNYFLVGKNNEIIELCVQFSEFRLSEQEELNKSKFLQILSTQKQLEILRIPDNDFVDCSILENLENLICLDISHNKIKNISFIEKMISLDFLDLSNNEISNIDNVSELIDLNYLDLSNNQIIDITPIKDLKHLEYLNLSYNNIEDITALKNLSSFDYLNLSSNQISSIDALKNLKELAILNLSKNEIAEITSLQNIIIRESLFLGDNFIFDLSPLYNPLKKGKINFLNAFANPLQYPPIEVVRLGEFETWDWFEKKLELARDRIKTVENNELDLGSLGLTNLSLLPELFELHDLEKLILSNHYAQFNNDYWDKVKSKNRHYPNNIIGIPPEIKKLKNLKKLIIGGDWKGESSNKWRIKNISNILNLTNLEILNISNNQISSIKGINRLTNLKFLYANNNKIKSIDNLGGFEGLEEIYLSNNQLTKVDFLKDLLSVKAIDLHSNYIKDLSPIVSLIKKCGIADDKWRVDTICISKNKLVNPGIEVVRNGTVAVLNQIEENNNSSKLFVNDEIKLILIGNSEAGKSTFASYLQGERDFKIKPAYTLWMDEINIKIGNVKVRLFDFGGHDYFHDTHHIFFTNNTIYFLFWDKKNNKYIKREITQLDKNNNAVINETQDYPLKYWLESVKHFIKDKSTSNVNFGKDYKEIETYSSKLLVIQNKVFANSEIGHLNNKILNKKYSFIYDFDHIDIHTGRNIDCVTRSLKEMITKSNFVGVKYPVYYKKN